MVRRPRGGGTPGTVWVHMHVCVYTYVCFMHTHVCTSVCTHLCVCARVHKGAAHLSVGTCVHVCLCTHKCVRVCVSQFTQPSFLNVKCNF